jgi:hypothetical protein
VGFDMASLDCVQCFTGYLSQPSQFVGPKWR